ncbi:hypothetical protein BDA96_02G099600 [Sorghum bicolor]|uniref:F-box domain-containing protein n=1 Tax=Sorghum bicolor TaxID=4558 RepID=A0A921RMJ6_SORBI|nr:hypothetical protein BDA96_02G099600 [Sorghum bicolor]
MEKVLGEDLVEDILLRLPPDDPVSLLRAATVCRRWCRIISAPDFRRRFGQRHRTAPMLGFFANLRDGDEDDRFDYAARFVPATPFLPRGSEHRDLDSRHGRVLLTSMPWGPKLEIWDPVTDELREIPDLTLSSPFTWNTGVVCADYAACECDHLDCRRGPFFLVVFVDADDAQMRVHLYSSEDGAWSEPTYGPPSPEYGIEMVPTSDCSSFSKYDLATRNVSVIHLPPDFISDFAVLMTTGDGGLGFARVEKSRLWICSMETDPMGDDFWVPVRSIELETLLQVDAHSIINDHVAFAHGVEVFFVGTEDGWFSIDLKSGRVREEEYGDGWTHGVVPYTSFYDTPDLHQYGVVPV